VSVTTFGSAQYQWHPDPKGGNANPGGSRITLTEAGGRSNHVLALA